MAPRIAWIEHATAQDTRGLWIERDLLSIGLVHGGALI